MNNLYEIVKSLQTAQGSLQKQAILDANADNALFKSFMKATYDVGLNYYIKKLPKVVSSEMAAFDQEVIDWVVQEVAGRRITGSFAATCMKQTMAALNPEGQELLTLLVNRSIGASVGDTMVLKTWPDLYFIPPYQRCSLMDDKAKERFGKLKMFYVQTKCDGSFAYIVKRHDGSVDVITRQGGKYPQAFAEQMAHGLMPGMVVVGELEVLDTPAGVASLEPTLLDRKTGNGILTSILKDGEGLSDNQTVRMTAWDLLTQEEFEAGKSVRKYSDRLERLEYEVNMLGKHQIGVVDTWPVQSLAEAFAIYTSHTSRGLEGCVAKNPDSFWKDGTSKDDVKMKLKVDAEFRCTGMYEGEGKAAGMMGGINVTTEGWELESNCGTGFSDKQRKEFFANPSLIVGQVVMLSFNDLIQSRDTRKKPSLSLPAFEEVRHDKTVANTLDEVVAIVEAAKNGK